VRSSTIVLKYFINQNLIVEDRKSITELTTLGGTFFTNKKGTVNFKLPVFFVNKAVEYKEHVDDTTSSS
jgi:hypothetical protein